MKSITFKLSVIQIPLLLLAIQVIYFGENIHKSGAPQTQ